MFERTVCACHQCKQNCKEQPGYLIPGDMERIAEHLNQPMDQVRKMFWASPGAVVMDTVTRRMFRIGTITPRFDRRKRACVFLTEENQCSIHAVAPFGCSHFDTHMKAPEALKRSAWGMDLVQSTPDYTKLRASLPFAEHWRPKGY